MSETLSESMPEPSSDPSPPPDSPPSLPPGPAPAQPLSDEAWMARYCGGDMKAFEELFARHARAVHDFFFYMTNSRELAVYLSQEAWLAVRKRRGDFAAETRFLPWLFSLAIQVRRERSPAAAADMAADRAAAPAAPATPAATGSPPAAGPPLALPVGDAAAPVHQALAAMADSYREVLVLHQLSGLGFTDIASALGATEAAVKARALQGYFQAAESSGGGADRLAADAAMPRTHAAIPLSRCPETEKLINLVEAHPEALGAEPLSSLVRHTQDCPLCEVTQRKVEAGHLALGQLAALARPETAALEQIARAVLPTIAHDFAPQRTGWAIVVAVLAFLLLLATTAMLRFH